MFSIRDVPSFRDFTIPYCSAYNNNNNTNNNIKNIDINNNNNNDNNGRCQSMQ